jgi:hypothetical protein
VLAYQHVSWFRAGVDDLGKFVVLVFNTILGVADSVFKWLANNWPLVLAILTGPFGLAIAFIVGHWGDILHGADAVLSWLRGNWPLVLGIIAGPFGLALVEIQRHWGDIWGFLTGLPGQVAHIFDGMWDGIAHAFKAALNALIDAWNSLKFTTPSIDVFGQHIGGVTIGVPSIPHLAQGGIITREGLVYAHAGEAITPAPTRSSPAVVVNDAHFTSELDIETFLRRAAWVASTARV